MRKNTYENFRSAASPGTIPLYLVFCSSSQFVGPQPQTFMDMKIRFFSHRKGSDTFVESKKKFVWSICTAHEARKCPKMLAQDFTQFVAETLSSCLTPTNLLPQDRSKVGHTPTGSYSRKGVLLPSRCLLESPFLETPSKNPSQNPSSH